ncbi:transglycosylase SLT domain-containing protein [Streptomyces radicis]|uniref:Lytic transglycosylase n=1 Tax=Streptomyces radicis TaxID=1750517 RepID=A0A3A9W9B7_9ACTN|nr:transglycosylase SLT domain-containing protein [Streptomyces radicis]RKN09289.1 lytic transglycosylase [Streptomyces radicis]RKN23113.1 lytic transglycosylase [Streptomyces radicis]
MSATRTPTSGTSRITARKVSLAGIAAAGAAAVAVSLVPSDASASPVAPERVASSTASPVAFTTNLQGTDATTAASGLGSQQTALALPGQPAERPSAAPAEDSDNSDDSGSGSDSGSNDKPEAEAKDEKAEKAAEGAEGQGGEKAAEAEEPQEEEYPDNLDGWIREALAIMDEHDIPGSYEGIHRNIMRESSGDPNAINNWDINARNGVPSKGLLQVIKPTFDAYHVEGTAYDQYDPVANIVAACNYAADRYGSMDNVDSAY